MSVTVVKEKGVTTITVSEDRNSMLPPLCQILKALCFSPACCSIKSGMMQTGVTAALGTVQIMVGLFNLGLGPGRTSLHPEDFSHLGVAYWLGGVFLVCGIISVLAGRFPSVCSVIFAVFMNIMGSVFSIVGIVMYSIDLSETSIGFFYDMKELYRRVVVVMDTFMLILIVLHLCVCITLAVLGIKALISGRTKEGDESAEVKYPLLKEVLLTSPGA
ncbi:uncharacterized protein LOC141801373 [Halichoeres trimaculatus]|uniref:uncharacterized protein LOC141801373 n=1 Tax=Halichoeres trimaculatus TaxID=147232 RepID=UPI003D9E413E